MRRNACHIGVDYEGIAEKLGGDVLQSRVWCLDACKDAAPLGYHVDFLERYVFSSVGHDKAACLSGAYEETDVGKGVVVHWHEAHLVRLLVVDPELLLLEVDIADVEALKLGASDACAGKELHDNPVTGVWRRGNEGVYFRDIEVILFRHWEIIAMPYINRLYTAKYIFDERQAFWEKEENWTGANQGKYMDYVHHFDAQGHDII